MPRAVVVGGTFDHLHAGHRKLLEVAASLSGHLVIGLTLPEMNQNKAWSESIQSYEERETAIRSFLDTLSQKPSVLIVPIHDVYGTTLEDQNLEVIVVTPQTQSGAAIVNEARQQRGLPVLEVNVCPLAEDQSGEVLSSSRIRSGMVDRDGLVYQTLFATTLVMSSDQKEQLHAPLGDVVSDMSKIPESTSLICVGDVVTKDAIRAGLPFASAWVDGHSHHQECQFAIPKPYIVAATGLENPPGTIQSDVANFMKSHLLEEKVVYTLHGEEDLLTLVAIMNAPLGSIILYGNPFPPEGIVVVRVDEAKKQEIVGLLHDIV